MHLNTPFVILLLCLPLAAGESIQFTLRAPTEKASPRLGTLLLPLPSITGKTYPRLSVTSTNGTGHPVHMLQGTPGISQQAIVELGGSKGPWRARLTWSSTPAPPAAIPGALLLETKRWEPKTYKGPAKDWEQAIRRWNESGPLLGQSLVKRIYHGAALHAPPGPTLSRYSGTLMIKKAGSYAFATTSQDGSFLRINGKTVAAWPGAHNAYGGTYGQYKGRIQLTAGPHRIEYLNLARGDTLQVVAGWIRPGDRGPTVIPEAAFLHATPLQIRSTTPTQRAAPLFTAEPIAHSVDSGSALITLALRPFLPTTKHRWLWTLPGGAPHKYPNLQYILARAGLIQITAQIRLDKKKGIMQSHTARVLAQPAWGRHPLWEKKTFRAQRKALLRRDPKTYSAADLSAQVSLAHRLTDRPWLNHLAPIALARKTEFNAVSKRTFLLLGFHLQHHSVRRYEEARTAFGVAISDEDPATAAEARLHLAGLLIHGYGQSKEGLALLNATTKKALAGGSKRLHTIFHGDAYLTEGDVTKAREHYLKAGTVVERGDLHYLSRRRVRLENAKHFLRSREYDKVEELIRSIEWETPLERLNTETGLLMIRLHRGRKELSFARVHTKRLLQVADQADRYRPDLLLELASIEAALGNTRRAEAAHKQLLDRYPYSEAAAKVER
ncbi:MAG: PA14 domain-containing protein [Planctomycetota bacterium]|jgi:hypothetical protein